MSCIFFYTRKSHNYVDLNKNLSYLTKAREHLEIYVELINNVSKNSRQKTVIGWETASSRGQEATIIKHLSLADVDAYLQTIALQTEVTQLVNKSCNESVRERNFTSNKLPTLFGNNQARSNLCQFVFFGCAQRAETVQLGFDCALKIIAAYNLNAGFIFSETAHQLAKENDYKTLKSFLQCINNLNYTERDDIYDECLVSSIRTLTAELKLGEDQQQQQPQQQSQKNKEIEELILMIKSEEKKMNAYIMNGKLKSAYLIAIKMKRVDLVKHIDSLAERSGQLLIKEICNKWLEKNQDI